MFKSILKRFKRPHCCAPRPHSPSQLLPLEPRLLLTGTDFLVTSLLDNTDEDGQITLREAIIAANTNTALNADTPAGSSTNTDVIRFADALTSGGPATIQLSSILPDITDTLQILDTSKLITIDADNNSGILPIQNTTVSITGLTLENASTAGNGAAINLENATLNLTNTTISNNNADQSGGGIYSLESNLNIDNATIANNNANHSGGGIFADNSIVTINNSTISGNNALDNHGGGIRNEGVGSITINNSNIENNSAGFGSFPTSLGRGGGISSEGIDTTVHSSNIFGNNATQTGGGIYVNTAPLTITNTDVHLNNSNDTGGGVAAFFSDVDIINSSIQTNSADGAFAGIWLGDATTTITNSVVLGNTSTRGAGISTFNGSLTINNSTITHNVADSNGGGIRHNSLGPLVINNAIVALNQAPDHPDIDGPFTANSSLIGVDPIFTANPSPGPDGFWRTLDDDFGDLRPATDGSSPAVNAGDNNLIPIDTFDIDNNANTTERLPLDFDRSQRVVGLAVDIGAYESGFNQNSDRILPGGLSNGIAFDTHGNLQIAYHDIHTGHLHHTTRNAQGAWTPSSTIDDSSPEVGIYADLKLNNQGLPGVAYYDAHNGDLKFAQQNQNSTWTVQTVQSRRTVGLYPSLQFDADNNPIITYYQKSNGNLAIAAWDGNQWNLEIVDSGGDSTDDVGRYSSLQPIPNTDRFAVAYENTTTGDFKYTEQIVGLSFNTPTIVDPTLGGGGFISLAFDQNNNPAFSYYDANNADLKLARRSAQGQWNNHTVASKRSQGLYTTLSFANDNTASISFFNKTTDTLVLATGPGTSDTWSFSTLANGGGRWARIVNNPSGPSAYTWWQSDTQNLRVTII